jgi:hypothetical protein
VAKFADISLSLMGAIATVWLLYRYIESNLRREFQQERIVVLESGVTELPDTDGEKFCKWSQITIGCATEEPILNCEVSLKSFVRIRPDESKDLVEEPVHCNWSQRTERAITIFPGLPWKANLFSLLKGSPNIKLELDPPKITLKTEIQKHGTYRGVVVVTASGGVRKAEKAFQFEWRGYNNISLDLL